MREDLLHFVWKYKKLQIEDLLTTSGASVFVENLGIHNHLTGPDFFNAKVRIDDQLWAGNVEIHIKSSDWYAHHHEKDDNYNNVILHVVWEDDVNVFRKDNTQIPTLELKNYISKELLEAYQKLFDTKETSFINCEKDISAAPSFLFKNWLERLYFERLEQKSTLVQEFLHQSKNDWEKVLFMMLLKNFGLKINGASFLSIAEAIDFSTVRKIQSNVLQLESVFFGLAGFLEDDTVVDAYYINLKKEYQFLKNTYNLKSDSVQKPDFFKLRPPNFPTIRLSQLAHLYAEHQSIFSKLIEASSIEEIHKIFNVSASSYWDTHFTFGKISKKNTKKLTQKFIDLIIINTLIPIKFSYAKYLGKEVNEEIIGIVSSLKKENNSIISNFELQGVQVKNANESQAVLQLYNKYCTQNKCLQCAVGSSLLSGNS